MDCIKGGDTMKPIKLTDDQLLLLIDIVHRSNDFDMHIDGETLIEGYPSVVMLQMYYKLKRLEDILKSTHEKNIVFCHVTQSHVFEEDLGWEVKK